MCAQAQDRIYKGHTGLFEHGLDKVHRWFCGVEKQAVNDKRLQTGPNPIILLHRSVGDLHPLRILFQPAGTLEQSLRVQMRPLVQKARLDFNDGLLDRPSIISAGDVNHAVLRRYHRWIEVVA